jgi:hypothetical protein
MSLLTVAAVSELSRNALTSARDAYPRQRSKRQRVAPYGSAVATPKAVWNVKR